MLEGEFNRFKVGVWMIKRVLVITPIALIGFGLYEVNQLILLIASVVAIQNAVALWIIGQST